MVGIKKQKTQQSFFYHLTRKTSLARPPKPFMGGKNQLSNSNIPDGKVMQVLQNAGSNNRNKLSKPNFGFAPDTEASEKRVA